MTNLQTHIPRPDRRFYEAQHGRLLRIVFDHDGEEKSAIGFFSGIRRGRVVLDEGEQTIPMNDVIGVYNIVNKLVAKRDVA